MTAYSGYTVGRIRDDLSWRQVGLLLEEWADRPPSFVMIQQSRDMLARHTGHKIVQRGGGDETRLLTKLTALGWLPGE